MESKSSGKILLGYDYSGSTSYQEFYHIKTQKIVDEFNPDIIVTWDTEAKVISRTALKRINSLKEGLGQRTNPSCLAKYIKDNNFHETFILITDGVVSDEKDIDRCFEILGSGWKFTNVIVYLLRTGGTINESVSLPFTRVSNHTIITHKNNGDLESKISVDVEKDYGLIEKLDEINTIEEFMEKNEVLNNALFSMFSNSVGNEEIKRKLITLKNKFIKEKSIIRNDPVDDLVKNPTIDNLDKVHKHYYNPDSDSSKPIWKKNIDLYILWTSGSLKGVYDRSLANSISNRAARTETSPIIGPETAVLEEITDKDSDKDLMECPITLEGTKNIVILIRKPSESDLMNLFLKKETSRSGYLSNEESLIAKKNFDFLNSCPLNAFNDNDDSIQVMKTLIEKIVDCAISLEAYRELIKGKRGEYLKSPTTRADIIGGLCLGPDSSHVKATNSAIKRCFTFGKKLGNLDLWYSIFYFMITNGLIKRFQDPVDKPIRDAMKEHMVYRLNNSKTYMSLSGDSVYPTYLVPLKVALWSVISAAAIPNKKLKENPIAFHLFYSEYFIKLIQLTDLKIPERIESYIDRFKVSKYIIRILNKGKENDDEMKMRNTIDALKYNAIKTKSGFWVLIDGQPKDEQIDRVYSELPLIFKKLLPNEIEYILKECSGKKKEGKVDEVDFGYNLQIPNKSKETTTNWGYKIDERSCMDIKVEISENTCRPFYILEDGRTWEERANEIHKGKGYISADYLMGSFVSRERKYPEKEEFLIYLSKYYYNYYGEKKAQKRTLPICIKEIIDQIFKDYQKVFREIDPLEFIIRWEKSAKIDDRKRIEKMDSIEEITSDLGGMTFFDGGKKRVQKLRKSVKKSKRKSVKKSKRRSVKKSKRKSVKKSKRKSVKKSKRRSVKKSKRRSVNL
jgi:hypothetical protein